MHLYSLLPSSDDLGLLDKMVPAVFRRDSAASSSSADEAGQPFLPSGGPPYPLGIPPRQRARHRLRLVLGGSTLFALLIGGYLVVAFVLPRRPLTWDYRPPTSPINMSDADPSTPLRVMSNTSFWSPDDHTHIRLPPLPSPLPPPPPLLTPIARPPYSLMHDFYMYGKLAPGDIPPSPPLDMVYLFVNASSPVLQAAMRTKADEEGIRILNQGKRWRDNGELRGAVRSAAQNLGHEPALRTIRIVGGDYPVEGSSAEGTVGQVPAWLAWPPEAGKGLAYHFHSGIFRLPRDEGVLPRWVNGTEEEWREKAWPSFDSFGIEGRVGWIPGLSENFILSNDDMFILRPLSALDFHHPLLGPVYRFDPSPGLYVRPVVTPDLHSTPGEWGGLQYASLLLSNRFPARSRPYMHHMPKALTLSLTHEASVIWGEELAEAGERGFRRSRRGVADVEMSWLVSHLGVERWREAVLWVWAVGKLGGESGMWGEGEKAVVKEVLGWDEGEAKTNVLISRGERDTLSDVVSNDDGGGAKATSYKFSSFDGHLPARPDTPADSAVCTLNIDACFPGLLGSGHLSAVDMFKHLAFIAPECGDCLITALVGASGPRGLSAVLPDADAAYRPHQAPRRMWQRSEPMLPLSPTWQVADFSLASVVHLGQDVWAGDEEMTADVVDMRKWSIKLLSRYAYVYGETPARFATFRSVPQLRKVLGDADRAAEEEEEDGVAMLCVNDDQPEKAKAGAEEVFAEWMDGRWGGVRPAWERG